jgi:hypothetical protein
LDTKELELFAIIAHKIWLRRNSMVFGGPIPSPSCLLKGARELMGDYRKSFVDAANRVNRSPRALSWWSKPAAGSIKINWDAVLDVRKKRMGVGIIARNAMGVVKAAMCTMLPYIQNPTVAEAIGARRVVEFAREMGFSSIEIEGVSREVVGFGELRGMLCFLREYSFGNSVVALLFSLLENCSCGA